MPVLPLHGPRDTGPHQRRTDALGRRHGHAAHGRAGRLGPQAASSRGCARARGRPAVGALGHSLGGYAVSLLASLEEDLDCVVAGNPAVDPSHLFWTNALAVATHSLSAEGIREDTFKALLRPVSPLALEPVVPHERRAIFAGTVDRVITPVQAHGLWRHWEQPRIAWYQGAHQRFLYAPGGPQDPRRHAPRRRDASRGDHGDRVSAIGRVRVVGQHLLAARRRTVAVAAD